MTHRFNALKEVTEGVGSLRHLKPTLSIKPRKGSITGAGPTKGELEALILVYVYEYLDTYRRLQEWSDTQR